MGMKKKKKTVHTAWLGNKKVLDASCVCVGVYCVCFECVSCACTDAADTITKQLESEREREGDRVSVPQEYPVLVCHVSHVFHRKIFLSSARIRTLAGAVRSNDGGGVYGVSGEVAWNSDSDACARSPSPTQLPPPPTLRTRRTHFNEPHTSEDEDVVLVVSCACVYLYMRLA